MLNSPMAARLQSLPPQLVFAVATVVIVAVFAWQGVGLFATWRGEEVSNARLAIRSAGSAGSGIGLEQVAKLHLFGEKIIAPVVEPVQTDIPQTNLKFVLVGAMTNSDAAKASALIATDKQTNRFFVGDSVATGVVLQEVLADAVVLKRNGKLETLSFPRADESAPSAPRRSAGLDRGFVRQPQTAVAPTNRPLNTPADRFSRGNPRANLAPTDKLPVRPVNIDTP